MVERIRITPSQIVTRDASNNITFNTDYSYLKTGSGTLYVGGYARAPAVFGQNTITDHNAPGDGWFTPHWRDENTSFYGETTQTFSYEVPKATYIEAALARPYNNIPGGYTSVFIGSSIYYANYYNYDTNTRRQLPHRYQWAIAQLGFGEDVDTGGYASLKWCIWPAFVTSDLSAANITNPSGGVIELTYTANEYRDFSRIYNYGDGYGNYYSVTQYGRDYYGARSGTDAYGNYYSIPASPIYWRKHSIHTKRDPVGLSLAVTP